MSAPNADHPAMVAILDELVKIGASLHEHRVAFIAHEACEGRKLTGMAMVMVGIGLAMLPSLSIGVQRAAMSMSGVAWETINVDWPESALQTIGGFAIIFGVLRIVAPIAKRLWK